MVANAKNMDALLRQKKLAVTAVRRQLLGLFSVPGIALSRREMEQLLEHAIDRVTLYRNLKTMTEHNILHAITMEGQELKYKLLGSVKNDDHPHFYCEICHHLTCLPQELINASNIPDGFRLHTARLVMEGVCGGCNGD